MAIFTVMKKIAFIFFGVFVWNVAVAQTDVIPPGNGGEKEYYRAFLDVIPEIEVGFPIDDFASAIDRPVLIGKGVSIFYRLRNLPVDIGVRFGDFSYDHLTRRFTDVDGIRLVQKTKNKIWVWYGAVRVEPKFNLPIPVYFEGAIGWRRFYTKTFFRERGGIPLENGQSFDRATLNSDWSGVYGGAIGIKIPLEKNYGTALDLQIGFKRSNTGEFYKDNNSSAVAEDPLNNLELQRSGLSILSLKIGISLLGYGVE